MTDKSAAKPPAAKPLRTTGLSPKEQRLLALRDKLAKSTSGAKPATPEKTGFQGKSTFAGKKTSFQRKAT